MSIQIPQNLLFGNIFSPCLAHTWLQLRCLAVDAGQTAACTPDRLAQLTGKCLATLYRHLRRLKNAGLLDWTTQSGALLISFASAEADPAALTADAACAGVSCALIAGAPADKASAQPVVDRGSQPEALPAAAQPAALAVLSPDSQFCESESLSTVFNTNTEYLRLNPLAREQLALAKSRINPDLPVSQTPPVLPQQADGANKPPADALSIYRRLTGRMPNPIQRGLLWAQVHDLPLWQATLEHWLAHGWNPSNVLGMLEMYLRGGECRFCPKPGAVKSAWRAKPSRTGKVASPGKSAASITPQAFELLRIRYAGVQPA
jgi:hypothetical protein